MYSFGIFSTILKNKDKNSSDCYAAYKYLKVFSSSNYKLVTNLFHTSTVALIGPGVKSQHHPITV
jgi:hypothetical protein